jgi:hypothetical protein
MEQFEYKNFFISTAYSFSGKTKFYVIWTYDFNDCFACNFKSIKSAKKYIDQLN